MRTTRLHAAVHAALAAAVLVAVLTAAPASAAAASPLRYVALGDSYSSGTGIGDYSDQDCRRSDRAFPHLLAAEIGAELDFAACSGARAADVESGQARRLGADTDLVTITLGGNDIEWARAIRACVTPFTGCIDDIEEAERRARSELPGRLAATYRAIAERAPGASVYVLGYPRLFNAEDECDAFGQISIGEQRRMNRTADVLAEVTEETAQDQGFTYVDVRDAFEGHAVCDSTPWINGLRHPISDSYHPNARGHSGGYLPAIAALI
ncbi:SGNH family lipase [Glycomyces albus]